MMFSRASQPSLFGQILDWMLLPLLIIWPMSAVLTWLVAQNIAGKPFDRELTRTARVVAQELVREPLLPGAPVAGMPEAVESLLRPEEAGERYWLQLRDEAGAWRYGERSIELPVPPDELGSHTAGTVDLHDGVIAGVPVRVASLQLASPLAAGGIAWVQVAQTLDKRERLTREIIKGVLLPQYVVLPLAVFLVWLALAHGIAPLHAVQARISGRKPGDLSPVDGEGTPEEVVPVVDAINHLLRRLADSIAVQKHFLADAAHQLKTPLAGLRMQAELAQRELAGNPQAALQSLQQIERASTRATHMVNQLLAMARADDPARAMNWSAVDLAELAAELVHERQPQARLRGMDLGYEGPLPPAPGAAAVLGDAVLLRELLGNLVDNALHYGGEGRVAGEVGEVTVRVLPDPFGQVVVVQVEDDGPGIPVGEHGRLFQPFYRPLGSSVDGTGLGLAIVREIAERHGSTVELEDTHPKRLRPGARFTVRLFRRGPPTGSPPAHPPSA